MRVIRVLAPNPGIRELEGTNTWIVGDAPALVIDPGPDDRGHLAEVARTAGSVGAIALTHDHPDHAPGALPLAAMTGARVFAARPVAGPAEGPTEAMGRIRDGDQVSTGSVSLGVVATPGHTPDHVAFFDARTGSLFTGDAVLGRGTSVIDPPEGDLAAYLRSLRRMRELGPRTIYPGHGPVVLRALATLDEYLDHRRMREEQILTALGDASRTPEEMVAEIYADYPTELHELAARSVLAHLLKLEVEGRADKRSKAGVVRWSAIEPRSCERCGRPVRGRVRLCGSCTVAVLQE
jgi:glyoxylase-like metal-dependent hydrolase (beta-lactamase superfamily II)